MAINKDFLGPQGDEEEIFSIEALVFSTQVALQRAMNRKGVSNKELAEKLGMTPARVSQIFSSNGPNLTLKTIARIAHALGEDFELVRKKDIKSPPSAAQMERYKCVIVQLDPRRSPSVWHEHEIAANGKKPKKMNLVA
ncbi:hypothetical protein C4N9_20425 [Pararhodobacter marinus]|uniref:HTH cro/C1-type domain-containing protein n=1 Tax=Pararhodobacter marinus TaxID=2184063 RepID=A0A2U2C4S1_9RHOB|nr:helix-turn-helix transcriptional regulator [Pararhodobacter marinus]PWE26804.1 hypothetical protein C4N9_20425 [Pararhodobacter marinus]